MLAIVGGMPRGGTTYAARALNACGIPAEHERAFSGDPESLNPSSAPVQVGWLGVAWFHRFRGRRILLARPPLNVIRSLDSRGWFSDDHPGMTVRLFLWDHTLLYREQTPLRRMARFYIDWMRIGLCHCDEVWPVHELEYGHVASLGSLPGVVTGWVHKRLADIPTDTNTAQDDFRELDWDDLGSLWDDLGDVADRLGVPMGYGDLERV